MSSARRTQEDLRRILGYQDTQGGLQPPESRLRIDAGRGVFVIGTGETKSGAGDGAVDDEGDPIDPVEPPEGDANQNDDGSGTGDSATDPALPPEIEVIDPEDSNYDVGDDLFGGNWGSNGKIGFVDCVDNTCVEIVPRGGYIDPIGYTGEWDAETLTYAFGQPVAPLDQLDYYFPPKKGFEWYLAPLSINFSAGPRGAIPSGWGSVWASKTPNGVDFYEVGGSIGSFVTRRSCIQGSSIAASCAVDYEPPEAPPAPWPEDGCIQLAPNADGQWVASDKENPNDLTPKYSNPKSILDLCTPSGDGVQILPAADGGSVFWNYSQGSFMAISPDGKRSFGSSSALKGVVAGAVYGGGDGPKAVGAPTPS